MDRLSKFLSKKTCFVFDFDGVIKDSVYVKTQAFEQIYQSYGSEIVEKVKTYHIENGGLSRYKKFEYYEKVLLKKKITNDEVNSLSNQFSNIVKNKVINSSPIPGVINFLDILKKNNILMVVNSATPLSELKEIIKQCNYEKYFQKIYGSPETKTNNLLSIMREFDIESKDIVFFGDAKNDLIAALEANINFIGVGNYFRGLNMKENTNHPFIINFMDIKLKYFVKA